jgi:recombination associated protein RdgC
MFFRNLTIFRFPASLSFYALDDVLAELTLKPVGALELSSRGFVSPFGRDGNALSHRIGNALWLSSGCEQKILPGTVVNDLLQKKLAEIEAKDARKLGGKARRRLKEDLVHELLPRALIRPSRTDALLDLECGYVAIDTTSRKNADSVVSDIRAALGSFPALPLNAEFSPRVVLTSWAKGDPLPNGLTLGDECVLRDLGDGGGSVRCVRQDIHGDEIQKHLESGKQVKRLALCLEDRVSFTLDEDLVIRKLRLIDGAMDALESTERDDLRAELDARFALFSGEVRRLFECLEKALKLSRAE